MQLRRTHYGIIVLIMIFLLIILGYYGVFLR